MEFVQSVPFLAWVVFFATLWISYKLDECRDQLKFIARLLQEQNKRPERNQMQVNSMAYDLELLRKALVTPTRN